MNRLSIWPGYSRCFQWTTCMVFDQYNFVCEYRHCEREENIREFYFSLVQSKKNSARNFSGFICCESMKAMQSSCVDFVFYLMETEFLHCKCLECCLMFGLLFRSSIRRTKVIVWRRLKSSCGTVHIQTSSHFEMWVLESLTQRASLVILYYFSSVFVSPVLSDLLHIVFTLSAGWPNPSPSLYTNSSVNLARRRHKDVEAAVYPDGMVWIIIFVNC